MDFDFSDDQEQLREAVSRWAAKAYTFERRRGTVQAGGLDRAAFAELAELGLTALTVPEAHGGMGMGAVDVMVVLEQMGKAMVLGHFGPQLEQQFACPFPHRDRLDIEPSGKARPADGDALHIFDGCFG